MTDEELIQRFTSVNIWRNGATRAPHKPLLLLIALAKIQRQEERLSSYEEIEVKLKRLLVDFGPPRRTLHPEQPFWRLQNDRDLWEIPQFSHLEQHQRASGDVSPTNLRRHGAQGGFPESVDNFLRKRPDLVNRIAAQILDDHFPSSLHDEILDAVDMPWVVEPCKPRRDPAFREKILRIYEYRCAVCGYDGRLGNSSLGLEVAHLMWHAAGGPNIEQNGVSLCTFHHKTLDRGAWGLDENRRILVSEDVHGSSMIDDLILRYSGRPLRSPIKGNPALGPQFIRWHAREVFRKPARLF